MISGADVTNKLEETEKPKNQHMITFVSHCEADSHVSLSNLIYEHRDELSKEDQDYRPAVDAALKKKQIAAATLEHKETPALNVPLLRVLSNFLSSIKSALAQEVQAEIEKIDAKASEELERQRKEKEKRKKQVKQNKSSNVTPNTIVDSGEANPSKPAAPLPPDKDQLATQYNLYAEIFSSPSPESNSDSNTEYFKLFDESLTGKFVLDLGCGAGYDMVEFIKRGAIVFGIDSAEKMVQAAKKNNFGVVPDANIKVGRFDKRLPFSDDIFDFVVSKWALQTTTEIDFVYNEAARVLKKGGKLICLIGHPMCQYALKQGSDKDYFSQQVVSATFWDKKVTIKEPTHTMNDYLSQTFFEKFSLFSYREGFDRSGEKIKGDIVPNYFILNAGRK